MYYIMFIRPNVVVSSYKLIINVCFGRMIFLGIDWIILWLGLARFYLFVTKYLYSGFFIFFYG